MRGSTFYQYRHKCQRGLQIFIIPCAEYPPEATYLSFWMILGLEAGQ